MKKSKKSTVLILIGLLILILLGIGMMFYPVFSAWLNEQTRSEVQSEYLDAVNTTDTRHIDKAFTDARKYNDGLARGLFDPLKPEENGYYDILDLAGTGIIGYITIPSIDVDLPIFHGTAPDILNIGAGHMPQSSFPVGGKTTHAVITAHSGMASSPMFSDITLMKPGDTFQIQVLNQVFTYQVMTEEDITIVSPAQIDNIQIVKGEDLCTLITCYPFGVNTERYLVKGHRIENPEASSTETDTTVEDAVSEDKESVWLTQWYKSVSIGFLLVLIVLVILLIVFLVRRFFRKKITPNMKGKFSGD